MVLKSGLDVKYGESLKALRVEGEKKSLELVELYLMIENLPLKVA